MVVLSTQDMVDCRRHLGYGFYGATSNNRTLMYWRYFAQYNTLEYRLANLQDEEASIVIDTYLPILNQLELQPAVSGNGGDDDDLDTSRAAVWYRNPDEIGERIRLYKHYCQTLAGVLQVPMGPWSPLTGGNTIRMLV
jgi:hypothetical protein